MSVLYDPVVYAALTEDVFWFQSLPTFRDCHKCVNVLGGPAIGGDERSKFACVHAIDNDHFRRAQRWPAAHSRKIGPQNRRCKRDEVFLLCHSFSCGLLLFDGTPEWFSFIPYMNSVGVFLSASSEGRSSFQNCTLKWLYFLRVM